METTTPPSNQVRAGFAFASLAHAAGQNLVMLLAFRYFTDNLGIAAATAGLLFFVVKIYDGITDPLIGAVSDQTKAKLGRRLPYLLGGSFLMPVALIMLFAAPASFSSSMLFAFLVFAMLIHATAYTAMTVPGLAMVVEVTDDFHERSTLMSFRVVGNTLGMLAGSTLPAWLLVIWGASRTGHIKVAWVVAAMVMISGIMSVVLLRRAAQTTVTESPPRLRFNNLWQQVKLAWNNLPFRILAIAHVFILIGTATTGVSNAYFTRYILKSSDGWLGNYYLLATVGVITSIPLWLRAGKIIGKKACYILAMLGFGLMHLTWLWVDQTEPYSLLVTRALLTGVASAGLILFAYSMLSDAIRYDYIKTGLRREGSFAGFTSLIDKVAAAIGIWGLGILMDAMGYAQSTSGGNVEQSDQAIMAIYMGFALVPAICMLFSAMVVLRYQLREEDLIEPEREAER